MDRTVEMIGQLSEAAGVSGYERDVVELTKRWLAKTLKVQQDPMGNLVIKSSHHDAARPTVVIDGHSDEVGFIVQTIEPGGLIRVLPIGGWIGYNAMAHRFTIINERGEKVPAITASRPPHFMTEEQRKSSPSLDDLRLDVGATSSEETRHLYGIAEGDPIVPEVAFHHDPRNGLIVGKAFDNRLGVALVVEVMNHMETVKTAVNVVGVVSTQEEVGLRGAQVVANHLPQDLAIVLEGSPADDTFVEREMAQGRIGAGTQIRFFDRSMISHPAFTRFVRRIAEESGIPHQVAVRKGGGTNAGRYHLSGGGVPSAVLGIPVRYAHTHYGISRMSDYQATRDLLIAVLGKLDPETMEVFK